MTCVNIVDHRHHCTPQVDAVVEMMPTQTPPNVDEIHPIKILSNTTVERVMRFAQRVKQPVVIFLYNPGSLDKA
jgi:hypothetical protein